MVKISLSKEVLAFVTFVIIVINYLLFISFNKVTFFKCQVRKPKKRKEGILREKSPPAF